MIKLNLLVRKLLFVLMLSGLLPGVSCMHKDVKDTKVKEEKATGKKTEKGKIGTIQVIIIGACLCVVPWFIYDFKYSQKNCPSRPININNGIWKNKNKYFNPPSDSGVYKGIFLSTNSKPQPLLQDFSIGLDVKTLEKKYNDYNINYNVNNPNTVSLMKDQTACLVSIKLYLINTILLKPLNVFWDLAKAYKKKKLSEGVTLEEFVKKEDLLWWKSFDKAKQQKKMAITKSKGLNLNKKNPVFTNLCQNLEELQPLPGDTSNHTTDTELLLDSSSSPSLSAQRRERVNSAFPKKADRDVNLNTDENTNINSLRIGFLPCELQPLLT